MSKNLLEQAKQMVQLAKKKGAQGVRISLSRSRNSQVEWRDGKLDRLRESTKMGMGITLFADGRFSSNYTSDLRPTAVEKFFDDVLATTRVLAADAHRKLPDPARYTGMHKGDLQIYDEAGMAAVKPEDRRKTAEALEKAARSVVGADKIISVTASYDDTLSESALVCSNGMEGLRKSTNFSAFAETSVKDEGSRRPEGWWYDAARYRADLLDVETIGKEATRRALAMLGGKSEKSGEYPCVVENAVVSRLLRGLMSPLSGQAIQQKRSFLAEKRDKQVGSPLLTLIDDPFVPKGMGSRTYDGEGMATKKRPIFEKGVLKNYLLDTYYASKLGKEPTTGSSSNLVFDYGKKDLTELLAVMDTGILITGFSGGNSNSATGDFSVGIRGHWVEKGKVVRAITEMNLAGNHLTFWTKLAELGRDARRSSSWRCPSLRFEPVQFSGA
ncbi:MAG: TldD/PmbA family protein [Deltaproteobacteria bacterium]|nr:TldD/PmbA family protein [Deltaproteobacteria bacterium]